MIDALEPTDDLDNHVKEMNAILQEQYKKHFEIGFRSRDEEIEALKTNNKRLSAIIKFEHDLKIKEAQG